MTSLLGRAAWEQMPNILSKIEEKKREWGFRQHGWFTECCSYGAFVILYLRAAQNHWQECADYLTPVARRKECRHAGQLRLIFFFFFRSESLLKLMQKSQISYNPKKSL